MSHFRPLSTLALVLATLTLASFVSFASDWPQFRGPDSTGTAADAKIPDQPKIDWSAPLPGRGLSSPIVVAGKVFVTCASGPKQERLHLICFNAADGARIWEREFEATGRTMTQGKNSVAACNDMASFDLDGNLLWVRGLTVDYPNASNSLGMASSPIVIGETVVTMIENDSESYALGLDANTGRNMWKLERPKAANWTSPVPWRADAKSPPVALLQSTKGLLAVDATSGSRLWEFAQAASTTSSSVVASGVIYAPGNGVTALSPNANNAPPAELWRSKQINPNTISPLVLDGRLFSINGAGVVVSADTKTGNPQWKLRLAGPFSGSPVGAGTRLLAVNEKGLAQIVDITAPSGAIIGTLQLPLSGEKRDLVLCTPALEGGHIFVRSDSALWRLGE